MIAKINNKRPKMADNVYRPNFGNKQNKNNENYSIKSIVNRDNQHQNRVLKLAANVKQWRCL